MTVGLLAYLRGRWRLRWSLCPLCNSSPPRDDCPVCEGSYHYGPVMSHTDRGIWRDRLEALRRN